MSNPEFVFPREAFPAEKLLSVIGVEADDESRAEAEALVLKAAELAQPKAVFAKCEVEPRGGSVWLNGVELPEPFVYEKLSALPFCVPHVCTCGTELAGWAESLHDPLESYWADKLMLFYLSVARGALVGAVKEKYFADSPYMAAINPGSLPAWPITAQVQLFASLVGGTGAIGVELRPSMLMTPTKSGSGIFFASAEHYENCQYCPRLTCPNRRAKYLGE